MRGAFRHTISQRKRECPREIHKHIVAVYGNVMNRQNVKKWCRKFPEGRTDVHDEVQEEVMTWLKGQEADFYDSAIQKLVPRLNHLTPNGHYMGHTAQLTSRCCILYIYIYIQQIYVLNILNMLHNLRFFPSKCRLFHNATFFGS